MQARLIAALIRHGDYHQLPDTPSAHQPFPLTENGMSQAQEAADTIIGMIDAHGLELFPEIDSSQMLRAWQTAEIIIRQMLDRFSSTPDIMSFDALAERGVGSVANMSITDIENIAREDPRYEALPRNWKSNSHFRLPFQGAESLLEAGARVATHIEQRMHDLKQIAAVDTMKLFVGHGAAFRHAAHHMGVLKFEQIAQLSMYHAQPVLLEYHADGSWRHIDGEWKVRQKQEEFTD